MVKMVQWDFSLIRFLVSGINGKNGAMGFFSDQFPSIPNQCPTVKSHQ
jgi:hypothetical protein